MPTHRARWNVRHGFVPETSHSIGQVARYAGMSIRVLREVYRRGIGAHETNPASVRLRVSFAKSASAPPSARLSKEQWAMARVYAFLNKLEDLSLALNHDTDLVPRYRVLPSSRKHKKYMAVFEGDRPAVHFGDSRYQQYQDRFGHYAHLDHADRKRRAAYYVRHGRHPEAFTAKWFAHRVLW